MLRGEFRCGSGLVIPNNVTEAGARAILVGALRNIFSTLYVGLCSAVYEPDLQIQDIVEPTLALNGYARQAVARDSTGWPSDGLVNGENYLETLPLIFSAAGGDFSQPVTRLFLSQTANGTTGDVLALSAPLPDDLLITPTTPLVDRTFKYRLYLR